MDSDYWCYQCNCLVAPIVGDEISCPQCNQGFVHQIDGLPQRPLSIDPRLLPLLSAAASRLGRSIRNNDGDGENPGSLALAFGTDEDGSARLVISGRLPPRDRVRLLANAVAGVQGSDLAGSGERVLVLDPSGMPLMMLGGGAPGGLAGGAALGDYFLGPGLESLIQRLMENDPNRYGTPPASASAVDALPKVTITDKHLQFDYTSECAVCKEDYAVGEVTLQLPCKHIYHPDCILPWLKIHSTCPVCRFEMPTDEQNNAGRDSRADSAPSASASSSSQVRAQASGSGGSRGDGSESGENSGSANPSGGNWMHRLLNQILSSFGAVPGGQNAESDGNLHADSHDDNDTRRSPPQ